MKIRSVGAQLFHASRRTDGRADRYDEANAPNNVTKAVKQLHAR
jgi:hypothetical protein